MQMYLGDPRREISTVLENLDWVMATTMDHIKEI